MEISLYYVIIFLIFFGEFQKFLRRKTVAKYVWFIVLFNKMALGNKARFISQFFNHNKTITETSKYIFYKNEYFAKEKVNCETLNLFFFREMNLFGF